MAKKKSVKTARKPAAPPETPQDPVEAAFALAATLGWEAVDFPAIAAATGHNPADLAERFGDMHGILAAFGRRLDRKAVESAVSGLDMSPRDRLFDLLMERFDGLNEQRDGIKAFIAAARRDPACLLAGLPHLARSMARMLEAAGVDAGGVGGALRVAGLTGLYLKTLRIWAGDDSPDLGRTMAALDRALARAEQAMALRFGPFSAGGRAGADFTGSPDR
jgi:hypothetical protein